jgi:hypothetical protein
MGLKANGSFGFGDISSGGGGGGEVNEGVNVGGFLEVFKQKVGVDLQFRTLNFGSEFNATQNTDDIDVQLTTDKWAIPKADGKLTYFADLSLAMAAAVSGETIQLLTDVNDSVGGVVDLKDGVNINLNGNTYNLSTVSVDSAFKDTVGVKSSIFNGTIIRSNSTGTLAGQGKVFYISNANSDITFHGVDCLNDTLQALYLSAGLVKGGGFYNTTTGQAGLLDLACTVKNAYFQSRDGIAVNCTNGAFLQNSQAYSSANTAIFSTASTIRNCTGYSDAGYGIYISGGNCTNLSGFSTGNSGIFLSGGVVGSDFTGYSTASYGIRTDEAFVTQVTGHSTALAGVGLVSSATIKKYTNVYGVSEASVGVYLLNALGTVEMSDVHGISTWDNVGGHGIQVDGNVSLGIYLMGGSANVTNSGANALYASAAKTPYFTHLIFKGASTPINANITNSQINTIDSFGNVAMG